MPGAVLICPQVVPALQSRSQPSATMRKRVLKEFIGLLIVVAVSKQFWLMLATAAADQLQLATRVKSRVLPSLLVPVALNCCVPPTASTGRAGVTEIDCNEADPEVTVRLATEARKSILA